MGLEHDWIATDGLGQVALFCTAGGGNAPAALVDELPSYRDAIAALETLGPSTTSIDGPLIEEWRELAERGLFVYDSDAAGGPYRRVALPVIALTVEKLPEKVASVARRICFRAGDFATWPEFPQHLLDAMK